MAIIDLGEHKEGSLVKHNINLGNQPKKVYLSCGCMKYKLTGNNLKLTFGLSKVPSYLRDRGYRDKQLTVTVLYRDNTTGKLEFKIRTTI